MTNEISYCSTINTIRFYPSLNKQVNSMMVYEKIIIQKLRSIETITI
jgi:hypothetical protein